ncbi:MAG: efflux transporter outer membrane subunit [Alphaproteobacteria bacterium]|jgi:outer membrane protein, multidrug efflux system|nr:efflux transporter outer membrane subunit [Henriciella sp.]MBO6694198.1 efflux transporter outer membrane subunit [Henriciella sp.]MCH9751155.1 efflux transporter outer membrane subunit [Alphaproteobacteria bacterium]
MKQAGLVFGVLALSACSTVPSLPSVGGEPLVVFPVAPDAPETWAIMGVSGETPDANWLAQFNDPMLVELVNEALAANPSIRSQFYAVEAARAQSRSVYGRTLPNLSGSLSGGGTSNYNPITDSRTDNSTFGVGLDFSWEIDLWGRLRAGINAAEADLIASEADLASARLALAAQTASAWFDLNEALAQERVAVQTFEARTRALELTERRFSRGLATALDVRTARTTQASAEASIAGRRQASGNASRRLEILLGRYPSAELDALAELPSLDPLSGAASPVLLLSRRPDIAAAEARVTAAGLRAEQARLAMLPGLRLTGSASTTETDLADALDPSRIAARLIAGLTAPIFNGGALDADRDAAVASARAAVENYAATTLTAWREVEDALAADSLLAQQENAQVRALEEARLAEELATRQYTNGLVSIFNLIDSQTRRLNAESNVIAARSARASNRVSFHLALGGGLPVAEPAAPDSASLNSPEVAVLP